MRKLSYILTFTLTAMLLAACSEDDAILSSPTGEVEGAVTFTATVDYSIEEIGGGAEKTASTRAVSATEDEQPTRFYAQALSGTTDAPVLSDVV